MSMWTGIRGKWSYLTGSSGMPTLPIGAQIIGISFSGAGGTCTINGGPSISVDGSNSFSIRFPHLLVVAKTAGALVFGSTTSYFVELVEPNS